MLQNKKLPLVLGIFLTSLLGFAQTFNSGAGTITGFSTTGIDITVTGVGAMSSSNFLSSVCIDLSSDHTLDGLEIRLVSSQGQTVDLSDRQALTGNTLTSTCFSDFGTGLIATGTAPYSGSFTAEGVMNGGFSGNADGTWELEILNWDGTYSDDINITNVALTFVNCQQVIGDYAITKAIQNDTLRICQNEFVGFSGAGQYPENNTTYTQSDATSTYDWRLIYGDGTDSTFSGKDWNRSFGVTGTYVVTLRVTDALGCDSDNDITIPIQVAGKPSFAGTRAYVDPICMNEEDTLLGQFTPFFLSSTCNPIIASTLLLPDIQTSLGVSYESENTISCYPGSLVMTNVSDIVGLTLNMEHSFVGDLTIELQCPNGSKIEITDFPGGIGANLGYPVTDFYESGGAVTGRGEEYVFSTSSANTMSGADVVQINYTDTLGNSYTNADYLLPGEYQITGNWSTLIGCPLNGDWTVIITDDLQADNGHIFYWNIEFDSNLPLNLSGSNIVDIVDYQWDRTPKPDPVALNDTFAYVTETTAGSKSYTFTVTDEYSCEYDTTISFIVLPDTDPLCASCDITGITANAGVCQADLTYDITGQIDFIAAPTTGTLVVTNRESGQTATYTAPFTSPLNYTITGNPGDGGTAIIVADFSDDAQCSDSTTINEPDCCTETPSVAGIDLTQCNPVNGQITISGLTSGNEYRYYANGIPLDSATASGGQIVISGLTSGTYHTFVVEDKRANGCTYNVGTTITLNDPTPPTLTIVGTDPSGCGLSDGCISISGLTSNADYHISYNGGVGPIGDTLSNQTANAGGVLQICGLGAGSYGTWRITSVGNGCSFQDATPIALNEPGAPTVTISSSDADNAICLGESIILTTTVNPAGGTATYTGPDTWSTGATFTPAVAGNNTYSVEIDQAGCKGNASVSINVRALPPVDAGANQSICDGLNVTLSGSGATSYVWTGGITDGVAFTAVADTFFVTGTDGNGCINTDSVIVTIDTLPNVSAGNDTIVCTGNTIALNGSGADSYSWAGPTAVTDGVAFTAVQGNYVVTGIDGNGCVNTDDMDVTVSSLPTVFAGNDTSVCSGDSITLNGSGATTYTWVGPLGSGAITDGVSFLAVPGNYTITGSIGVGCDATDVIRVTLNNPPSVVAGFNATICAGDSVQLSASSNPGGATFTWDNGVVDGDFVSPSVTTTYTVTGVDANQCSATDQIEVAVDTIPNVFAGNDTTVCTGAQVVLYASGAGVGNAPYTWTGPVSVSNGIQFTATAGQYIVVGQDGNLCEASDTMNITVTGFADVSFSYAATSFCNGAGTLALPILNNGPGAFSTDPASGLAINGGTGEITVDASTAGTYKVYQTIAGSCGGTDSTNVTIVDAPTSDFTFASRTYCDSVGVANITLGIGSTFDTIFSVPSGVIFDVSGNIDVDASSTGTYVITDSILANATSGCPSIVDTFELTIHPQELAGFSYPSQGYCVGNGATINATTAAGTGTFTSTPAGLSLNAGNGDVGIDASTPDQSYTVTHIVTGTCPDTSTARLNIVGSPSADIYYVDSVVCDSSGLDSIKFVGLAFIDSLFALPVGVVFDGSGNVDVDASTPGTYMIYNIIKANVNTGCPEVRDSFRLTILPIPNANFSYPFQVYCKDTVLSNIPNNNSGSFSAAPFNGGSNVLSIDNNTGEINVNASDSGMYTVVHTISGVCPATAAENITIAEADKADFSYPVRDVCLNSGSYPIVFGLDARMGTMYSVGFGADVEVNGDLNTNNSFANTYIVYNQINADPATNCPMVQDTFAITINDVPVASLNNDPKICEDSVVTIVGGSNIPNALYDFYVDNILVLQDDPTGTLVHTITTPNANTPLQVNVKVNGCVGTANGFVEVQQMPQTPEIDNDILDLCNQDSVTINGTIYGGIPATWSIPSGYPGVISDVNLMVNNIVSGIPAYDTTYVVLTGDADACGLLTDTLMIINDSIPLRVRAGDDIILCAETNAELDGNYPISVDGYGVWTSSNEDVRFKDALDPKTTVEGLSAGGGDELYWTIHNPNCNAEGTDTLVVSQMVTTAEISFDEPKSTPASVELSNVGTQGTHRWYLSSGEEITNRKPTIEIERDGIFVITLEVETENGCLAYDTDTIRVGDPVLYFPNAFTPLMKDDVNDSFGPIGDLENVATYELKIYNRYGELVFEELEDPMNFWDGTRKGSAEKMVQDTYTYVAKCTFKYAIDMEPLEYKGSVMLLQ